jgi:hypothetical protein
LSPLRFMKYNRVVLAGAGVGILSPNTSLSFMWIGSGLVILLGQKMAAKRCIRSGAWGSAISFGRILNIEIL